ncbi:MAG: outer membrane lipoprotein-sorting protein [Gammaproteobacteria bacterium]|nr:outer membrane lipoprotein-sorting protein [Gammaproteobacteria bacterium]MCF6229950.1 outer membrane lipoprotein-sorting protein [Gammaproteobacteria bacterium]
MIKWSALLLSLLLSSSLLAETPQQRGLAIATAADEADNGWGDSSATMIMTLRNRQGDTTQREIRNRQLEVAGDGDKSLSIFDSPNDVKGTAFLSHTHATKADDQWLYLPALKRVKRISSNNKSGPFMGSEFAYEDITSQELAKYSYRWLKDELYDGRESHVIERIPTYKHSGYTQQIVWIDSTTLQALKVDFYDRKGALLKTLTNHEYQQYNDKFWRAGRMEMVNHITGKSTTLSWTDYKFSNGYTHRDFDKNSLKRIR